MAVLVALMALGLAAAAVYPLWKGVKEEALPSLSRGLVVQDGVAYSDADELALDRALGRVGGESPAVTVTRVDLEAELERQVAAWRRQRRIAPPAAATAAGDCPQCGQAYDVGDRFCVRCGASLIQACPNCGHPYDADDLFCSRCGQTL